MNEEEALEIVQAIMDKQRRYPIGIDRLHHLLSQLVAECWDEDDVATLAEEPPFPAT